LAQEQQAFKEQQSIMQGLGGLAGTAGGFALAGLPGAAIGGGLLSGKGVPSFGGGGSNALASLSSKPFGGLWS
jgi:hypothetical protein